MRTLRYILTVLAFCLLPISAQAANKYWISGGTGIWDTNTASGNWSNSDGGATCTCVPGVNDAAIFTATPGAVTVTINTNVNLGGATGSLTLTAFTGTLDNSVNNNSITLGSFTDTTGGGAHTLKMGSGTWTITNPGNGGSIWDSRNASMTLNAGTSTLLFAATSSGTNGRGMYAAAGQTFATVTVQNYATPSAYAFGFFTGGYTIGTLNLTAPLNVTFLNNSLFTITNPIAWAGSTSAFITLAAQSNTTKALISIASGSTASWAAFSNITFSTSAISPTSSFDMGGNNFNGGTLSGPTGGASGGFIIGGQ